MRQVGPLSQAEGPGASTLSGLSGPRPGITKAPRRGPRLLLSTAVISVVKNMYVPYSGLYAWAATLISAARTADTAVPVFVLLFGTRFLCFALRISNATAAAIPVAPGQGECHKRILAKFNCFKCCEFPVQQLPIFHSRAPQYGAI